MTTSGGGGHGVVDAVAAIAEERCTRRHGAEAAAFVRSYYERVADEDLDATRPDDLYGAAMAHRRAGAVRPAGHRRRARSTTPTSTPTAGSRPTPSIDIVTDDMPFLVDSVTMVLAARHLGIHVVVHPMLDVERDAAGRLVGLGGDQPGRRGSTSRSTARARPDGRDALAADIRRSLDEVRLVVDDWAAMRDQALALVAEVEAGVPVAAERGGRRRRAAALDGRRRVHLPRLPRVRPRRRGRSRGAPRAGPAPVSGLLRDEHRPPSAQRLDQLPAVVRDKVHEPRLLVVTKANSRSTVHRPDYFAYVGVKRIDADGRVRGGAPLPRPLGGGDLPVHDRRDPGDRPQGRRRPAPGRAGPGQPRRPRAVERARDLPRDDLFQISEDELLATALEILNLQERRQLRLFARRDDYGRFVSCLIYVPRERYSTTIVERMEEILLAGFGGVSAEYDSSITASVLARLHVLVFVGEDAPDRRRHRARWSGGWPRSRAGGSTTCATRWSTADGEDVGLATVRPLRRRLPGVVPRGVRAGRRGEGPGADRPPRRRRRAAGDRPVPARRRRAAPASSA